MLLVMPAYPTTTPIPHHSIIGNIVIVATIEEETLTVRIIKGDDEDTLTIKFGSGSCVIHIVACDVGSGQQRKQR